MVSLPFRDSLTLCKREPFDMHLETLFYRVISVPVAIKDLLFSKYVSSFHHLLKKKP
jgi:hypothetical protein